MADVTISNLSPLSVTSGLLLPVTDGTTTGRVSIGNINSLAPVQSVAARTGAVVLTKTDVGLGNVENKSSATIRSEIVSSNLPSGSIINVVQSVRTDPATYNTNRGQDNTLPGLAATITPISSTSKILVNVILYGNSTGSVPTFFKLYRNSVQIGQGDANGNRQRISAVLDGGGTNDLQCSVINYLDTPGTTASLTYNLSYWLYNGAQGGVAGTLYFNQTANVNNNNASGGTTLSSITLTEIRG